MGKSTLNRPVTKLLPIYTSSYPVPGPALFPPQSKPWLLLPEFFLIPGCTFFMEKIFAQCKDTVTYGFATANTI